MLRFAAMAAMLSGALAVPAAWTTVSHVQSLELRSPLPRGAIADVETRLESVYAGATGATVTATASQSSGRRLQAGSSSLTITYVVACGSSCDTVTAALSDASADVSFANSIIAAVTTAAAASGFDNVVLSTPADVMSSITVPDTVSITLPPAPSPPTPPTPPTPPQTSYTALAPTDFELSGSCMVDGDVLSVTQVEGSQLGECYAPVSAVSTDAVRVTFDMYCGDGSGADGMCVNLGANSLGGRVGEDGVAVGAALCFDEWANNGDHGVMMFYNGATVWEDVTDSDNRSGEPPVSYFEDAAWHSVVFDINPSGGGAWASFNFDNGVYGAPEQVIMDYSLPSPAYVGFTGRTGGATNNHWARNIQYAVGDAAALPPVPPTPAPPVGGPPPPPSQGGDGGCMFTIYGQNDGNAPLPFVAASDACIEAGGHLASAHSQVDADAFAALVDGTSWIGFHDMGFEAGCTGDAHVGVGTGEVQSLSFVWTDGTPSDYENWADGEPNDWQDGEARCDGTGNEDCAETWNGGDNWNDAACDAAKPYICGVCPNNARNPALYTFFDNALSKSEAEFACILGGGHLASLHSQADQDLLQDMVTNTAWIGYHDRAFEAGCTGDAHTGIVGNVEALSFVWTDGTPSDYENWADGEPNDWQDGEARCDGTGNEDCTEMWNGGANWNDAACDAAKPYICGYPGAPSSPDAINVAAGLPTGDCAFDPCVAAGTCPLTTNHALGGNQAGDNGIRTCGAASSSTVGWGGEPDRAIDGNADGAWGANSCTHTDGPGSFANAGTHWWQVDLGQTVAVESVDIYHRTDCCQTRLLSAQVSVSTTSDYTATGTVCGEVDDHLGQPDVTLCNGAAGQFVTVEMQDMVITICELTVMGVPAGGSPPPPPPSSAASIEQIATGENGVTVQLTYALDATQANVYAMAGTVDLTMSFPPAFQVGAPFGTNLGGVPAAFIAVSAEAEFDSWLTIGATDGSLGSALAASPGLGLDAWTASAGFTTNNGAVFMMNPNDGPSGTVVMAQLTVSEATATAGGTASAVLQGRSTAGLDWSENVAWTW